MLLTFSAGMSAQNKTYFVDGYHGGIYGHYPIATYTRFMADQLDKNPEWNICLEIEPETWDSVAVRTPSDYIRFKKHVLSSRVEITNPTYAQPYMYNISGESIIRQFQYGIRKTREHFPGVELLTYSVEEPCFTSSLPQILNQLGFKYASLKCPDTCWGGYTAAFGLGPVNWIGPDGSSIIAVPRYECESLQAGTVWQTIAWGNTDEYVDACLRSGIKYPVGMCYQDAGWTYGPWIGYGENVRNGSQYLTWRQYFENVINNVPRVDYQMSLEDMRPGLVWGSQVLQKIARKVRVTENNIVNTEKVASIAILSGSNGFEQSNIDEAWRTLMLAQHHDSWIVPYNRLNSRGTWADNIDIWTSSADSLCQSVIEDILGRAEERYLLAFNLSGNETRSLLRAKIPQEFLSSNLLITDSNKRKVKYSRMGDEIIIDAELPPFSVSSFRLTAGSKKKKSFSEEFSCIEKDDLVSLKSDKYEIVLDPSKGGVIVSLKTRDGYEYVNLEKGRGINELKGWFYDKNKWVSSADSPAEITVRKIDDMLTEATISGTIGETPFEQTIILKEGQARIDMSLKILWKENVGIGKYRQDNAYDSNERAFYDTRYNLNLCFPVNIKSPKLFKDAPFDVCESKNSDTFFDRWDSIKHNVMLNWVSLDSNSGNGFALFSDHTTSYSYSEDYPLSMTVQFSGNGLWGRDYSIESHTEMNYSLMPHCGNWKDARITEESEKYNGSVFTTYSSSPIDSQSLINTTGSGYIVSAFYPTEGGYILRLYNAAGDSSPKKIKIGFPVSEIVPVDLKGEYLGKISQTDSITIQSSLHSIRTFYLKTDKTR